MKFPEQYRYCPDRPDLMGRDMRTKPGDTYGAFLVPAMKAPKRRALYLIACDGEDLVSWEHVSVSLGPMATTPPTWEEMCFVKALFWDDTQCVVQYHPAKDDYVNIHVGVLHLWMAAKEPFPMPPKICV